MLGYCRIVKGKAETTEVTGTVASVTYISLTAEIRIHLSPKTALDLHALLNSIPNVVQRLGSHQVCLVPPVLEPGPEVGAVV